MPLLHLTFGGKVYSTYDLEGNGQCWFRFSDTKKYNITCAGYVRRVTHDEIADAVS